VRGHGVHDVMSGSVHTFRPRFNIVRTRRCHCFVMCRTSAPAMSPPVRTLTTNNRCHRPGHVSVCVVLLARRPDEFGNHLCEIFALVFLQEMPGPRDGYGIVILRAGNMGGQHRVGASGDGV
jgi:hypothetical protein